jgi:chromosomal replication initiator protein
VAFASAQSVVEEPGQQANPLVLFGPVGTGKTHLLEGIYVGLRKRQPDLKILYVTAEDFVNRFVASIHQNKQYSFRKQFRETQVLLLDDLNFLARAKASQIEFLHTFDAILNDGAQIVVTCDCHPRLSDDLMPELIDRLIGGAVWSLLPPDQETRLAILRSKATDSSPSIPEPILKFLAEKLRGNVRELEGAIHSIRHYARATSRAIDLDLVREALGDLLRHAIRAVTMSDVDLAICSLLNLPKGALKSKAKAWSVSHSRMLAIYLCRKLTAATYGEISVYFGNKTHSTAVAAEKKVRGWIEKDERVKAGERDWNVRELLERVERELQK